MAALILIAYFIIDSIISRWGDDRIYFLGDQFCDVLLVLCVFLLAKKPIVKSIAFGLLLAVSFEMVDETLGNNASVFHNDYLCIGISIINALLYYKWQKSREK